VVLVVDRRHLGTTEAEWAASVRLRELPALELARPRRVVVVAPHPDDEVFGTAGLVEALRTRRIPIEIVAVTDGEGSHPLAVAEGVNVAAHRRAESEQAWRRLGWSPLSVTRLGLPDGDVGGHLDRLGSGLAEVLRPDDLCLAPWWRDGHPDHDACGNVARVVARSAGAQVLGYLVWAWHWARPVGTDLPWDDCRRLDLGRRTAARKRWASGAFHSQTRPLGPDHAGAPLLPPVVLRRFWRRYEVFVEPPSGPS
jgi:LmbE family N-acetylglucosaminyl deacetylase